MIIEFTLLPPMNADRDTPDGKICLDHEAIFTWTTGGTALGRRPCVMLITKIATGYLISETFEQVTAMYLHAVGRAALVKNCNDSPTQAETIRVPAAKNELVS